MYEDGFIKDTFMPKTRTYLNNYLTSNFISFKIVIQKQEIWLSGINEKVSCIVYSMLLKWVSTIITQNRQNHGYHLDMPNIHGKKIVLCI